MQRSLSSFAFGSRKGLLATMQRPCSRNLHQTIAASPVSSGSTIYTETIELEGAFIFGIAVRRPSGSIPRRGRARSPSHMARSRKSHFTTPRSLSRTRIKKPAPRERCQPDHFTTAPPRTPHEDRTLWSGDQRVSWLDGLMVAEAGAVGQRVRLSPCLAQPFHHQTTQHELPWGYSADARHPEPTTPRNDPPISNRNPQGNVVPWFDGDVRQSGSARGRSYPAGYRTTMRRSGAHSHADGSLTTGQDLPPMGAITEAILSKNCSGLPPFRLEPASPD
jgi:hypothetical protein